MSGVRPAVQIPAALGTGADAELTALQVRGRAKRDLPAIDSLRQTIVIEAARSGAEYYGEQSASPDGMLANECNSGVLRYKGIESAV